MNRTFVAQEVAEIPASVAACLSRNAARQDMLAEALRAFDPQLVIKVARGSSDHAASYFKYACEILTGIPAASVGPSIAPPLHPLVDPLLRVVTFYAFIKALARRRGLQPDAPRHLRKITEAVL